MKLNSFYVIPGYTFFYWGFTLPKREYPDFINFFKFRKKGLVRDVSLIIRGKKYPAKLRVANITTKKFPHRQVVQIYYENEQGTLKAFRKLFVYSYASTINKTKSDLKEILELVHLGGNEFRVKVISRQKTDFDEMFRFLEDKNLFDYWRKRGVKNTSMFIDFARKWYSVNELKQFANRVNVIYLLYHSTKEQLYVGKANKLGERVQKGKGRIGLASDWDRFTFFEIDPKFNPFIEQIEAFLIRVIGSLLENNIRITPLRGRKIKLVNKQLVEK